MLSLGILLAVNRSVRGQLTKLNSVYKEFPRAELFVLITFGSCLLHILYHFMETTFQISRLCSFPYPNTPLL